MKKKSFYKNRIKAFYAKPIEKNRFEVDELSEENEKNEEIEDNSEESQDFDDEDSDRGAS